MRKKRITICETVDAVYFDQGSHTSQMRKFKGILRVIKGSTAHFQGYFWKIVVTLVGVNKNFSDFSHLFQDCFGLCSILRRFQYFF